MQTINIKIIMMIPGQMQLCMILLKVLFSAESIFLRAMWGLKAAHLNQQVVVTGGQDDERNNRDEVLCGIL